MRKSEEDLPDEDITQHVLAVDVPIHDGWHLIINVLARHILGIEMGVL